MHGNSKQPHVAMFGCGASHSVVVLDPCWSESLAAATTTPLQFHKESTTFSTHTTFPALENFHNQQSMLQIDTTAIQGYPDQYSGNNQKGKDQL